MSDGMLNVEVLVAVNQLTEWLSRRNEILNLIRTNQIIGTIEESDNFRHVLLDLIGAECRKVWASSGSGRVFRGEFLREPYISRTRLQALQKEISGKLTAIATEILTKHKIEGRLSSIEEDIRRIVEALIKDEVAKGDNSRSFQQHQETIGEATTEAYGSFSSLTDCTSSKNHCPSDLISHLLSKRPTGLRSSGILEPKESEIDPFAIPLDSSPASLISSNQYQWYNRRLDRGGTTAAITTAPAADYSELEIARIENMFLPADFEEMCARLRGVLLPNSVRRDIWSYRLLSRSYSASSMDALLTRELARLGNAKGISLPNAPIDRDHKDKDHHYNMNKSKLYTGGSSSSSNEGYKPAATTSLYPVKEGDSRTSSNNSSSSISELVTSFVEKHIKLAFATSCALATSDTRQQPTSSPSIASSSSPSSPAPVLSASSTISASSPGADHSNQQYFSCDIRSLKQKAEVLVTAGYILHGNLSDRSVAVSLLVLRAFSDEPSSPISETILRLCHRISTDTLPAEILHKEYSIATVSQQCWILLRNEDQELYQHLQELGDELQKRPTGAGGSSSSAGGAAAAGSGSGSLSVSGNDHHGTAAIVPVFITLLKGWLLTGFVGWLPEHAVLYIWDQIILCGNKEVLMTVLPRICCELLKLIRSSLLKYEIEISDTTITSNDNSHSSATTAGTLALGLVASSSVTSASTSNASSQASQITANTAPATGSLLRSSSLENTSSTSGGGFSSGSKASSSAAGSGGSGDATASKASMNIAADIARARVVHLTEALRSAGLKLRTKTVVVALQPVLKQLPQS